MKLVVALFMVLMTTLGHASEAVSENESATALTIEKKTEKQNEKAAVAEEQIPININTVKKASTNESYMSRLVMIVGFMTVFAGGAFLFTKKYGKPGQSEHTQIKVLTQHYLGPKKSLAIVRVAGESVLIGVTDNSINLIKSLSLLDDEIPEATQTHFENALQDQEKVQQMGSEEFSIRHIKDVVSLKLKGMRNDL